MRKNAWLDKRLQEWDGSNEEQIELTNVFSHKQYERWESLFVREYDHPQPKYKSNDTVGKWPVSNFEYLDECEKQCEFQKSDREPKRITMPPYDETMKK